VAYEVREKVSGGERRKQKQTKQQWECTGNRALQKVLLSPLPFFQASKVGTGVRIMFPMLYRIKHILAKMTYVTRAGNTPQ
jgi:hypothetical protein